MAVPVSERTVRATAPVRICDLGGWTDTWFAGHGAVFHIAVRPGVEVQARVVEQPRGRSGVVTLGVDGVDEPYSFDPAHSPGRQPLLEATIAEVGLPSDAPVSVALHVSSGVPAGSSMGTSAAVTVALIGALDLLSGRSRTAHEVAALAHRIETERVGTESGVQDQVAAAFGGINYVEIRSYPDVLVIPLSIPEAVRRELERRLVVVSLGRPHDSSAVHARVIARLQRGAAPAGAAELDALRRAATAGRAAVEHGDLEALARAMVVNTEAQRRLHPDLVGADAQRVIDLAAGDGAAGWKVNGAGGGGGSVTLLSGADDGARARLVDAIAHADLPWAVIPVHLSSAGLQAAWMEP
jgi:D-glycero-alpha-D-manno-heptose-7-phosphate kinase